MKKDYTILKLLIALIVIQLFNSCDCMQKAHGIILDKITNQPIDSVYIHKIGRDIGEYSNEKGFFEIRAISGGVFKCPAMKIELLKKGYAVRLEEIECGGGKTIYLDKVNK